MGPIQVDGISSVKHQGLAALVGWCWHVGWCWRVHQLSKAWAGYSPLASRSLLSVVCGNLCRDWANLQQHLAHYDAQRETVIKRSRGE